MKDELREILSKIVEATVTDIKNGYAYLGKPKDGFPIDRAVDQATDAILELFNKHGYKRCVEVMGGVHGHILEDDGKSHNIRPDIKRAAGLEE
jgi:hypothetical protein